MNYYRLLHTLIALICSITLSAQTNFKSGIITNHEEWSDTIKVNGDITIEENGELIVNPGTYIEFQDLYKIRVKDNGKIRAIGNISDSIYFTCLNKLIGWKGFLFDSLQSSSDSSVFSFCKLQYTKKGYEVGGVIKTLKFNKLILNNCVFSNNQAYYGGAIYADSSDITIENCSFYNNTASKGAGIYSINSNPLIFKSFFTYNESSLDASAIYFMKSNPSVTNCFFYNNYVGSSGGEVMQFESSSGVVIGCKIQNNRNVGIYFLYSDTKVINSLIANNGMSGIKMNACSPSIINSTIVNNIYNNGGGGIDCCGSNPLIYNTIVWNNIGSKGNDLYLISCSPKIYNSNIKDTTNSNVSQSSYLNNISSYPNFISPIDVVGVDSLTFTANWDLRSCSPCINKGNNSLHPDSILFDLNNNSRIFNDTIDIGAYEVQESQTLPLGRKKLYVKEGGNGTGSSWDDALGDLQNAINVDLECYSGIDIWLAKGKYYPNPAGYSDERLASFILRNNVTIYGGFIGDETSIDQRDFVNNISELSGNIGNPNLYNDNSRLIIKSENVDSTCVIDGVCVSDGYYFNFKTKYLGDIGSGMYLNNSNMIIRNSTIQNNVSYNGGGLFLEYSDPSIINSTIQGNRANNDGGGIFLYYSSPKIIKTTVCNNKSSSDGGGIFFVHSNSTVQSSKIINNICQYDGGGLSLHYSDIKIINSIIANNSFEYGFSRGGGISCDKSNPTISNSLIANNKAQYDGGGIFCSESSPNIVNSIIWNNYTQEDGLSNFLEEAWGDLNTLDTKFTNCIIEGGNQFGIQENNYINNINDYPRFVNPSLNVGISQDGLTADWSINSCSPCINNGTLSIEPVDIPSEDIEGNERIFNESIDIGPYEFIGQETSLIDNQIVYVKENGESDGTSWDNPTNNIQEVINLPIGCYNKREIWIAEGVYYPEISGLKDPREASFKPRKNIEIYGGFIGNEVSKEERNIKEHLSILSGDIGVFNDESDNSYHVVTCECIDSTSIFDGLIIENGNSPEYGGGLEIKYSNNNILNNLTIRNNYAEIGGGGIYCESSNTTISNSFLNDNNSFNCVEAYLSNLEISNCEVFNNNNSNSSIETYFSNLEISNCEVFNNNGTGIYLNHSGLNSFNNKIINNYGEVGGIFLNYTSALIVNCLIANNLGSKGDGGIKSNSSKTSVINSTIVNNKNSSYGAGGIGICNHYDTVHIANSILWGNVGTFGQNININYDDSKVTINNSNIEYGDSLNIPSSDFQNNISIIPQFINHISNIGVSSNAFNANWKISERSPCIDKGFNYEILNFIEKDLSGNPRIYNEVVDMGAYEYQGSTTSDLNSDIINDHFILFPNPAKNYFIIQNKEYINTKVTIKIFSIDGKLLKSESFVMNESITVDIDELLNGVYLVQINKNDDYKQLSKYLVKHTY